MLSVDLNRWWDGKVGGEEKSEGDEGEVEEGQWLDHCAWGRSEGGDQ